jgi:hypothetical protein
VLLRSSERNLAVLAINCNGYKRNISGLKMNFSRRGRGTKGRKRNFPNKEKGMFLSAGSVTRSQIAG